MLFLLNHWRARLARPFLSPCLKGFRHQEFRLPDKMYGNLENLFRWEDRESRSRHRQKGYERLLFQMPDRRRSVWLAKPAVGDITQHDRIGRALELLVGFRNGDRGFLAQGLSKSLPHFGIAGYDLRVEPEKVAHLVEHRFEDLQGLHLRGLGESFQKFRVGWRLHGGAVEFVLDDAQVIGNAQDAQLNIFHALLVRAQHGGPFCSADQAFLIKIASDRKSTRLNS